MPTDTVENYLKKIYVAQEERGPGPVPMGLVARALGITAGTATTMIKGLAERGLADYEPRVGVGLTDEGRQLAIQVLRRHRVIEYFLVETLGLNWAEIHEEAERLEHATSERVLDRLDAFLGHPTTDPHGDPIPSPSGDLRTSSQQSLADCPTGVPLTLARILDQESGFLRFAEEHGLTPGARLTVNARDPANQGTQVTATGHLTVTLAHADAAKVLVE